MVDVNFLDPEHSANPHPALRRLREESPVFWSAVHHGWFLTRYEDVRTALQDRSFSAHLDANLLERVGPRHPLRYIKQWMVFQDPPAHSRLRNLVLNAFTPAVVARLEAQVQVTVDQLIDGMLAKGGGDLVEDFAFPLPAIVFSELFGVPPADRMRIGAWSHAISAITHRQTDGDRLDRGSAAIQAFADYLTDRIERARAKPGDDLLSRLVHAREEGDLLNDDELIATSMLFLFAGHDTTAALIGNGVLNLHRHPSELVRLRRDPELMGTAIDELNRFEGPGFFTVRHTLQAVEFSGAEIPAGQRVYLGLQAGNRDPQEFAAPDTLDLGRSPNRHLGFGTGQHFCLGANLAKLETRMAIGTLLRRIRGLRVDLDNARWRRQLLARRLDRLSYRIT